MAASLPRAFSLEIEDGSERWRIAHGSFAKRLNEELDAIDTVYAEEWLARWPGARNPLLLETLVDRVTSVVAKIEQFPAVVRGAELTQIIAAARRRAAMFTVERANAARFRTLNADEIVFGTFSFAVKLRSIRLARHLAERPIAIANLSLLAEIAEDVCGLREGMIARAATADAVVVAGEIASTTAFYKRLRATLTDEREKRYARTRTNHAEDVHERANEQLRSAAALLAHSAPLTRRPRLLERVRDESLRVAHEVAGLDGPSAARTWTLDALFKSARACETDLARLCATRKATPLPVLLSALHAAAAGVLDEQSRAFVSHGRGGVDPDDVSRGCDELHELQRQMVDVGRVLQCDVDYQSLWVTSKRLMVLESEHARLLRMRRARVAPPAGHA